MHLLFLQGGSHDHIASGGDAAHPENSAQPWAQTILPSDRVSYMWRDQAISSITNRHAPHSQHFDASSKDCRALGIYLQCLPTRLGRYKISAMTQPVHRYTTCPKLYLWPERWMLQHHRAVTKLLDKAISALDS